MTAAPAATMRIRQGFWGRKMVNWMKRLLRRELDAGEQTRERPAEGKTRDADRQQLAQSTEEVVVPHDCFHADAEQISELPAPRQRKRTRTLRLRRR